MCNCISYNRPDLCDAGVPEMVLEAPAYLNRPNGICVDACIADVIKMLWEHEVVTLGCCCGHNRFRPMVVIGEHEDGERVKALLRLDGRDWDVQQWRLMSV